jgi:hypothetical protein
MYAENMAINTKICVYTSNSSCYGNNARMRENMSHIFRSSYELQFLQATVALPEQSGIAG